MHLFCSQVNGLFKLVPAADWLQQSMRTEIHPETTYRARWKWPKLLHGHFLVSQLLCVYAIQSITLYGRQLHK